MRAVNKGTKEKGVLELVCRRGIPALKVVSRNALKLFSTANQHDANFHDLGNRARKISEPLPRQEREHTKDLSSFTNHFPTRHNAFARQRFSDNRDGINCSAYSSPAIVPQSCHQTSLLDKALSYIPLHQQANVIRYLKGCCSQQIC